MFRKTALAAAIAFALVVTSPAVAYASTADDEAAFVNDINSLRLHRGLTPLVVDAQLTQMARDFCVQMANAGQIFHNPNLTQQAPDNWMKLGENVGVGGSESALHQAFVNSPAHYRNLVDPDFRSIGVGVLYANGRMWVVEDFMKSSTPPSAASVAKATQAAAPPAPPTKASRYRAAIADGRLAPRSSTQKLILNKYLAKG